MEVSFRLWSLKFQQKTHLLRGPLIGKCPSLPSPLSLEPLSTLMRFAGDGTLTKQTPLIGASRAYLCRELYIPISPSARESQKFLIVIWLLDCIPWSGWRHWLHSYRIKTKKYSDRTSSSCIALCSSAAAGLTCPLHPCTCCKLLHLEDMESSGHCHHALSAVRWCYPLDRCLWTWHTPTCSLSTR